MQFSTWIKPRESLKYENNNDVFGQLKDCGINCVYVLAFSPFGSDPYRFEKYFGETRLGYDALKFYMDRIVEHGLYSEIWMPVYPNSWIRELKDELITGVGDKCWLCPTSEKTSKPLLQVIKQLVKNYGNFNGLNADYVRCSPICPERIDGSKRFPRCEQGSDEITKFIRKLSEVMKRYNKRLSVDVFVDSQNDGTTSYESIRVHQDWRKWAEEGYVDRAIPLIYTKSQTDFEERVKRSKEIMKINTDIELEIGIGVKSNLSKLTPEQMGKQIRVVKKAHIDRVALFPLHGLTNRHLKILKNFVD